MRCVSLTKVKLDTGWADNEMNTNYFVGIELTKGASK